MQTTGVAAKRPGTSGGRPGRRFYRPRTAKRICFVSEAPRRSVQFAGPGASSEPPDLTLIRVRTTCVVTGSERLGDTNVTSIDVSPEFVALTRGPHPLVGLGSRRG